MRKRKWIAAAIIFLVIAVFLLPQAAADIHFVLSKDLEHLTIHPADGWRLLISETRVRQFYLIFAALIAVVLLLFVLTGSGVGYRSNMQRITPDIVTPCPEGQGQFGTARWMKPEDVKRYFAHWKPKRRRKWFKALLDEGKESYREVEKSDVELS